MTSSSSRRRGWVARARATSSRLRRPMGSEGARLPATPSSRHVAITRRAASRAALTACTRVSAPIITLSSTERLPKGFTSWKVRVSPSAHTWWGASPLMSRPSSRTVPVLGAETDQMTVKSVVLPAPLGPMMPRISPGAARRLTSFTAVRPPKRLVTASSSSIASHRAQPLPDPADQALGHEAHDHDEQAAVDDQVDADEPRLEVAEGRAQVDLERGDEERAHEGADRGAESADDAVQREADREVDRED